MLAMPTTKHPDAVTWLWNYFLGLRQEADLAAHAAGGSLDPTAFSYERNVEDLADLRKSVAELSQAEIPELEQTLHELDDAFARFAAGRAGYPEPHGADSSSEHRETAVTA
jgi:hypothetical protein